MTDKPSLIYAIRHIKSGKRYVGSSCQWTQRRSTHKYQLNAGIHHCVYLQNAWNKYGADAFEFVVLEELSTNNKMIRSVAELKWINEAPSYNSMTAHSNLQNFQNSPETRKKIADGIASAMQSDPEYRQFLIERGAAMAEFLRSDIGRKRAGENTKKRWADPKQRKELYKGLKRLKDNPDFGKNQSEMLKRIRGTPEARLQTSISTKALWANPNSGLRNRKQTRWADPKAKERQAAKMRAYHAARRATA